MTTWRIELLAKTHDRSSFDCGEDSLNRFLMRYAGQDARKDVSRTYVAIPADGGAVAGYYTLSSGGVAFDLLPEEAARRLPRYPIPVAHLGRLAVDKRCHGPGLGGNLLIDALRRVSALADQIGIHAVTVDALNDRAASFYRASGFMPLKDSPRHLFLPTATIRRL